MNLNQYTQKSIEAVKQTQSLALENGNQQIEQVHLLSALLDNPEGLCVSLLRQAGVSPETVLTRAQEEISRLPKVGGLQSDRLYLSRELDSAFTEAEAQAKKMKDEFVSVEHLMLALILKGDMKIKDIFRMAGLT